MAMYRDTIGGWVHLGQRGAIANQIENVAYLAIEDGRPERAARLLGAAEWIREDANAAMALDEGPEHAELLSRLNGMSDRDALAAAWQAGRALSQADAVALALED
jgi:hypothetical protein